MPAAGKPIGCPPVLAPADVEVLQQHSPRHPVDRQVVNDQINGLSQATQSALSIARRSGSTATGPRPSPLAQHVDVCMQATASTDRASGTVTDHSPAPSSVDARPQHRMPIQQRLQQTTTSVSVAPAGASTTTDLVELVDRALHVG